MAGPSISNIAVNVGMNAAGLQKGAQQAAQAVKSFSAQARTGLVSINSVSQQATFAVDDFFASFSTGGVAGGIRGATNNLTMIAASLGGIKAQLAVIGVLTIGQVLAKQFDAAAKAAEKASDATNRAAEAHKHYLNTIGQDAQRSAESAVAIGRTSRIKELSDAMSQVQSGADTAEDLRAKMGADLSALNQLRTDLAANQALQKIYDVKGSGLEGMVFGSEQAAKLKNLQESAARIQEQITAKIASRAETSKELTAQEKLNDATADRIRILKDQAIQAAAVKNSVAMLFGAAGISGPLGDVHALRTKGLDAINSEMADIRERMQPSFSMAEMFTRFPGANAMGSVGAVSAINAAQGGSQNARDAGLTVQRDMARDVRRLRELEEKKKGLEVVPL